VQRLLTHAIATDEETHIAGDGITLQSLRDKRTEPINLKAFRVSVDCVYADGHTSPLPPDRNRRSS
jgi:hypothetical protein